MMSLKKQVQHLLDYIVDVRTTVEKSREIAKRLLDESVLKDVPGVSYAVLLSQFSVIIEQELIKMKKTVKELVDRDKPIHIHSFSFNPKDNGGEQLVLTTKFIPNGDPGCCFTNQEITLHSYCNEASIMLSGATIDSEMLRKLANELDEARFLAKSKLAELERQEKK